MLSSRLGRSSSARRWLLLSVRSATSSSVTTAAATATTGRFTLASWQKNCWDSYLATGRGSDDLFQSIDSDQTKKISKQELDVFLQSVNYKGVHPRAFKMLDELASDHEITLREFKSWLVRSYNHPYLLTYLRFDSLFTLSLGSGNQVWSIQKLAAANFLRKSSQYRTIEPNQATAPARKVYMERSYHESKCPSDAICRERSSSDARR